MRKSPGRVARPVCLVVALLFFVATVLALVVGGTQRGETGTVGLQMATTLAMLSVLWVLIGIMFSLAGSGPAENRPAVTPPDWRAPGGGPRVDWFQEARTGSTQGRQS